MGEQNSEEQSVRESMLRILCRLLTSKTAILLYSIAIAYYDNRRSLDNVHEYAYIMILFSTVFWYAVIRGAVKSFVFSVLVFMPLVLDLLICDYAYVYFGAYIQTVIATAFDATGDQVGMYSDNLLSPRVVVFVLFIIAIPVMGWIAGDRKGVWKSVAVFAGVAMGLALIVKSPLRYHLAMYKEYDKQWETLVRAAQRGEAGQMEKFKSYVDSERSADAYLPYSRIIRWWNAMIEHYFPVEYENSADSHSECRLSDDDQVNVALYIVESFRRDHTPFAGYERNTIPLLYGKHGGNMIFLPNIISYGTHSIQSLCGMLSDADENDRNPKHTSFQSLFRKHGFNCVLVENNAHGSAWSSRVLFRQLLKDSFDSAVILHDDNRFPLQTNKHVAQHKKNMFVIYDGTSHYPFEAGAGGRYGESLVDRYDETRHVIDAAASDFLDSLEDTAAIVLITSDHGESFGEGGRTCHGGPLTAMEQREVFAVIWYSDLYAEKFPEIVSALKANASKFVSQDYIFHTMPSMGKIHSSLRKPECDMTEIPAPHLQEQPVDKH